MGDFMSRSDGIMDLEDDPDFRKEVERLGGDLFDGKTTQAEHDQKLRRIQMRYSGRVSAGRASAGRNAHMSAGRNGHLSVGRNAHVSAGRSLKQPGDEKSLKHKSSGFDLKRKSTRTFNYPRSDGPDTHDDMTESLFEPPEPEEIIEEEEYIHPVKRAFSAAESFVQEWTPFGLVASYYIFSVCLYMVCNDKIISVFWFVYLTTNFYIAACTVLEAIMSMTPCREARRAIRTVEQHDWTFPTEEQYLPILDLVTVAYLPNEKDIIMDRIQYAVDEIIYPRDKIRINIVYNTPFPIEPLESQINELGRQYEHLRIVKVPGSKSKADNLNYFFTLDTGSDVIAVFDCDHYPHPCGPRWAAERFVSDKTIDIVQGRCVIFNSKACALAAMIAVEFDKIYAVSHPGRAVTWGFGLFTGSNGYWRASLLRDLRMHGDMLTEDIDSSLRAVGRGAKTVHDMNVVSYELAPTTLKSFWSQRLRWAQGWTQASIKHIVLTFDKPTYGKRTFLNRAGLLSLLFIRELSYYLVTQYLCLVIALLILDFPTESSKVIRVLFFQYPVAYWLFIISAICLIITIVITYRVKSEFVTRRMMVTFSLQYPFYLILTATIGLYGHAREVAKYTSWNPTARG